MDTCAEKSYAAAAIAVAICTTLTRAEQFYDKILFFKVFVVLTIVKIWRSFLLLAIRWVVSLGLVSVADGV